MFASPSVPALEVAVGGEEFAGGGVGGGDEGAGGCGDLGGAVGSVAGVVDILHGLETIKPAEEAGAEGFRSGGVGTDLGEGFGEVDLMQELAEGSGEGVDGFGATVARVGLVIRMARVALLVAVIQAEGIDPGEELLEVVEGLEGIGLEFAGGQVIADGAAGAERDARGRARAGKDAGGIHLTELAEGNDLVQEIEIFTGLPLVHAPLLHVGAGAHRHAGADGVEGMRETGEAKGLHIITEVEFVESDGFVDFGGVGSGERMFEVEAATGGVRVGSEVGVDPDEVVWVAGAVGIEADDGGAECIASAELIEAVEGFIHADLAGQAYAGVFAGEAGCVEEMNAESAVLSRQTALKFAVCFARPEFSLGESAAVLFQDFRRRAFGGVDNDDDFDGALRTFAAPEGLERGEEVGFVIAGDNDDEPEMRMGWIGKERRAVRRETKAGEVIGCGWRRGIQGFAGGWMQLVNVMLQRYQLTNVPRSARGV